MELQKSIVAILNDKNSIIGTGFVAGEHLILTCAHVIESATAGLNEQVTVRFAADGSKAVARIETQSFSPSYERDVALLRVELLPPGVKPLPLALAAGSAGHDFSSFGYASVIGVQGIGARGKIVEIVDNGRLVQLTSQEPDHGMSGGPVVDEKRHVVIGMVTKGKGLLEKDQNLRNTQTTFATSADVLFEICPELKPTAVDETSGIDALVDEAENVNVVAEVVGGDKVTNVYNYYNPSSQEKNKPDMAQIRIFFLRAARSWVTWVALVLLLAAGSGLVWYQQQPVAVSACKSNGENYVILVGKFEAVGVAERDVSRFIADDLTQKLGAGLSPTNFIVCEYPRVLKSDADALTAAQVNHAVVIVWGNYTPEFVESEIQVGDTSDVLLAQDILARTVNVRVRLKDERQDSVARQVMAIVDTIVLANGNIDGYFRGSLKLFEIQSSDVNITSTGVAAYVHQYGIDFVTDTPKALDEINLALQIDAGNPILLFFQSAALQRLGKFDESMDSAEAAARLGPQQWISPMFLKVNRDLFIGNYPGAIKSFGQYIEAQPSDWYPYNMRGYLYLMLGDLERAKTDIDQSLALNPQENWPYTWAVSIALRQGRLADARSYIEAAFVRFPDADAGEKVAAIIAKQEINPFTPALSAFWSMNQGLFTKSIQKADLSIQINPRFTDAYLIKGLSYCNLDKYAEAEAAYTEAIALEPQFTLLYLLRAGVRGPQGNLNGAMSDFGMVQTNPKFKDIAQAALQGDLGCKNFLTTK